MRYGKDRPAVFAGASVNQDLEQVIAQAQAKGTTTRIGVDLRLYSVDKQTYLPWKGMGWKAPLASVAGGMQLAEGIDLLMQALAVDPDGTLTALKEITHGLAQPADEAHIQEAEAVDLGAQAPGERQAGPASDH